MALWDYEQSFCSQQPRRHAPVTWPLGAFHERSRKYLVMSRSGSGARAIVARQLSADHINADLTGDAAEAPANASHCTAPTCPLAHRSADAVGCKHSLRFAIRMNCLVRTIGSTGIASA